MKTCPHSVHSFSAVRSLFTVEVSRSVRAAAVGVCEYRGGGDTVISYGVKVSTKWRKYMRTCFYVHVVFLYNTRSFRTCLLSVAIIHH